MAWVDVKNTQQNSAAGYGGGVSNGSGPTFNTGAPWWMLGGLAVLALFIWKGKR